MYVFYIYDVIVKPKKKKNALLISLLVGYLLFLQEQIKDRHHPALAIYSRKKRLRVLNKEITHPC